MNNAIEKSNKNYLKQREREIVKWKDENTSQDRLMKQKKKKTQEEQLGWQFVSSVAFLWTVKKRIKRDFR